MTSDGFNLLLWQLFTRGLPICWAILCIVVWWINWKKREPDTKFDVFEAAYVAPGVALVGAIAVMFPVGAAVIVAVYEQEIKEILSTPLLFFPAILLGIGLFMLKCRYRVAYGAIEGIVGIAAISYALAVPAANLIALLLPLASGIYILVRSLDNMTEVLKHTNRLWKRFFFGPDAIGSQ